MAIVFMPVWKQSNSNGLCMRKTWCDNINQQAPQRNMVGVMFPDQMYVVGLHGEAMLYTGSTHAVIMCMCSCDLTSCANCFIPPSGCIVVSAPLPDYAIICILVHVSVHVPAVKHHLHWGHDITTQLDQMHLVWLHDNAALC